jgi:hypothetical protein
VPEPLEQAYNGLANRGEKRVAQAGDEQSQPHSGEFPGLRPWEPPPSDTSSNALFGALQVTAANDAGLSPTLMAAANNSGGVLGKMISPQNLAIGAAAVGLAGKEGDLFRKVVGWSLLLILVMCVLVYLQSTPVLEWMVV